MVYGHAGHEDSGLRPRGHDHGHGHSQNFGLKSSLHYNLVKLEPFLAGGPGGSGIATAKRRRFPLFLGLTEHADVIALDQRGTGKSTNLPKCTSSQSIDVTKVIDIANTTSRYRNAALECHQFWQQKGIDVLGYTSVQNALDLDDLRKHFEAQKVSLWGISYGSHLAFAAMSLFEDRIDKVVIASAEGLNQTVKLPSYTSNYFARVQAQINANEKLKNKFRDEFLRSA